jgi:beta-lactamase class A
MRRLGLIVAVGLILLVALFALNQLVRPPQAGDPSSARDSIASRPAEMPDTVLESRLAAIVKDAPGHYAIAAKLLGTDRIARVNGSMRVPLMSVVKLPVAIVVLDGVDRGRWTLETPITLRSQDMHPRGMLGDRYPRGGGPVSIRKLAEIMITHSDNSAADALMHLVGGPREVTAWLERHDLHDLRVDRTELGMGNDWYGLEVADTTWTAEGIRELRSKVPAAVHDSAARAMQHDVRDTGTPEACVRVLERLWHGDLLSAAMTDTLKAMLARCATSEDRLPGLLPKGTPIARKTGTGGAWNGVTVAINDVGVMRLPNGEDVAIAVLVAEVHGPVFRAERTIARIARAVFDAWSAPDSSRAGLLTRARS